MNTPIQLTHLKKQFGQQVVLRDINLTVGPGEIVGLIGPSGSGKTTVIKTMLGMEKATAGSALVLGQHMPNREILADIGYMAQTDALYETLTAKENLAFFSQMKGVSGSTLGEEINHVSTVVNLLPHLQQRVAAFSGGMKRRLSLAIALLGHPRLLILDEPTVGIDPALRRKIWGELRNLRRHNRSILITTHVMDEAEQTNRVALLRDGQIIALASPAELKQQYGVSSIEDVFLKAEKEDFNAHISNH